MHLPSLAARLLAPRHFTSAGLALGFRHDRAQRLRWEVFRGRLLDPAHTRQVRTFASWGLHVMPGPPDDALISLKHDAAANQLHVVRAVEGYAWQGRDAGGGVIEASERRQWAPELIATVDLAGFDEPALERELEGAVARALHGARLPLTPIEAPHPLFSFGRLAYRRAAPHRAFEAALRGGAELPTDGVLPLARRMFDDISLSPWTDAVPRLFDHLDALADAGKLPLPELVDFQSSLLRLLARHLTAYDLVTFHHRGANYPDALLLDLVLRRYLARAEEAPALFAESRLRRRALRQAFVVRRRYEGHPVPDAPTSPGERMRVYPGDPPRIDEEQILQPARRRMTLFAGVPTADLLGPAARDALRQSVADLALPGERRELGAAVYLDRPLGGGKATVEPDATPLFASLAYSRHVAAGRLRLLEEALGLTPAALPLDIPGVPLKEVGPAVRQGTVSLADAAMVSGDFVYLHTLPGSRRALLELFDWGARAERLSGPWLLTATPAGLRVLGPGGTVLLEAAPDLARGYASRGGVELPAAGLRVRGDGGDTPHVASRFPVVCQARP